MARCREYIQNVTTITKVVRISDNGKASQIPFTPIMAGKARNQKNKSAQDSKCDGRLYLFHALIISDNGEVQNKEDEPRAIIRESFYRYACGSIVNAQE